MKDKLRLKYALFFAVLVLALIWGVWLWEISLHKDFSRWGILPRTLSGLKGIILAPLVHANLKHLYSNSIPLFVLTFSLFYFHPARALKILLVSWISTGTIVWLIARPAYHIGASGVVYALTAFHFFYGIISARKEMLAISLIVVFLYGSAIWGMLPSLAFDVSWESHAAGYFTGLIIALFVPVDKNKDDDDDTSRKSHDFELNPDLPVDFDYEYKE